MSISIKNKPLKGGEFLIKESTPDSIFIPEDINEDQKMMIQMSKDFIANELEPVLDRIEKMEEGLAPRMLEKIGELGILSMHMPEKYGGTALDYNTNTLIYDTLGPMGSFNTTLAAHTGIGMLPILLFGTEEQKEKYLPKLMTGELKSCYCLTEPGSGSDSLAAKTRADLSEDGKSYVLNGQKMWISNAGFADVFIVFAQVDGDKFTGFIVDKGVAGLTLGEEEDKMGIKGSSTRQVFFENARIPINNVLGEIGKGHLIAFNALNFGRLKLGNMCIGGAKKIISVSTQYANERHQFDQPISNFGAIKYKIAEMAIKSYVAESALYRISNLIAEKFNELVAEGISYEDAKLNAAKEYAIECSFIKIAGSETLDYCADENIQIHGGIGFSEEYSPARTYRDSRINRIYEGTNEINRLLIVDMLLKRSMKGAFDLIGSAWEVQKELAKMPSFQTESVYLGKEKTAIENFKKIALMVLGAAGKKQMDGELNIKDEQMIVTNMADILTDAFLAESVYLRILKLNQTDRQKEGDIYESILSTYLWDTQRRIVTNAQDAVASFSSGDLLTIFMNGIKRFSKYPPVNVSLCRNQIADEIIQENEYKL